MTDKRKLLKLLRTRPADIAVKCGYEKLTPLHNAWIKEMIFGTEDHTLQAHRGSFKTTCDVVAFADMLILFPGLRIIFLRKTDSDVAEVMNATANLLEHPWYVNMVRELYGVDLKVTKATQSSVETNLALGVSGAPQLMGLGCGGSLTGKHADRVFTDDIINMKDRVSAAERERIKLIYMELQNIKNRGGRIFNTGTPWHKDDAFQLMPNIEKWDCYSTGLMTRDEIEAIRKSMSRSMFAANYELKHVADEDAMFTEPRYTSDKRTVYNSIGHIDAAYGGEDGTAFSVVRKAQGTYYCFGKLWPACHVDKVLPQILDIAKRLRVGTIYCETNADKGYLRKEILDMGHPCAGYAETANKYIKIATHLKRAWPNIEFLDCEEFPLDAEYINQILDYNEFAAHDDAPDSLASSIRMLDQEMGMRLFKDTP